MKYGKDLISRGACTTRIPAMTAVIFANLRGTVRIKSVCAMAKIAFVRVFEAFRERKCLRQRIWNSWRNGPATMTPPWGVRSAGQLNFTDRRRDSLGFSLPRGPDYDFGSSCVSGGVPVTASETELASPQNKRIV